MTNTPSKEEVAKAQEWLLQKEVDTRLTGDAEVPYLWEVGDEENCQQVTLAELLASYAAEQGRNLNKQCDDLLASEEKANEIALALSKRCGAAESRLTSLREGLRDVMSNIAKTFEKGGVRYCVQCGMSKGSCTERCVLAKAESLLAELSEEGK